MPLIFWAGVAVGAVIAGLGLAAFVWKTAGYWRSHR